MTSTVKILDLKSRCGFVSVIGPPNAGKSTLVNKLVGRKVSIVSPKVQTTRTLIRGVANIHNSQVIFIDTPGIFDNPKRRLERAMVLLAKSSISYADMRLLIVDGSKKIYLEDENILNLISSFNISKSGPVILVINKIDALQKSVLLEIARKFNNIFTFYKIFMISALKGDGTNDLFEFLSQKMPYGPWLFPNNEVSDMPKNLIAAEITREKVFFQLNQELPYQCYVETDEWDYMKDGSIKINQTIYVSKESQKPILIGKGGLKLKKIGEQSRKELKVIFKSEIHLFLRVSVKNNWNERHEFYKSWGLDFSA